MRRTLTATLCAVAGAASIAAADTVTVTYDGTSGNYGSTVSVQLSGGLYFQDGSSSSSLWAGQLTHTIDGISSMTFCIELTQWVGSGEYEVVAADQALGSLGQLKAEAIYRLYNATNRAQDLDTNAKAAAFQAVLWELVYDFEGSESGINMASGNVQFTSGVNIALFNLYAGYAADTQGDITPSVIALTNDTRQNQLLVVPLPGAAAMAGLGLAGIAVRRRRV